MKFELFSGEMSVKFKLSKAKESAVLSPAAANCLPGAIDANDETETEQALSCFDRSLDRKRKNEPLVIPLIKRKFFKSENEEEKAAAAELLSEVKELNEKWENRAEGDNPLQSNLIVDMMASRAEHEGEQDNVNSNTRPESSNLEEYDKIPINGFGMAMLRGMGFKKDEGIGRTFKQTIKPTEVNLRPRGLGLGATPMGGSRDPSRNNEDDEPEKAEPKAGNLVQVLRGPHKGTVGKMVGYDGDSTRILVQCDESESVVSVPLNSASVITEEEKLKRNKSNGVREVTDQNSAKSETISEANYVSKKKKSDDLATSKTFIKKVQEVPWLLPDIKVRVIDKKLNRGRHYKEKVRIVDVITPFTCDCRTDDNVLLENLPQSSLETVVPKMKASNDRPPFVKIVRGRKKGMTAEVLSMDKEKCLIEVLIIDMEEEPMRLTFDDVSELAAS